MTDALRQVECTAATWLARRDADDWSPAQQAALDAWLDATPDHRVAFLRLEAAWTATARLQVLAAGTREGSVPPRGAWADSPYFAAPAAHLHDRARKRPRRLLPFGIAAGLLAVALIAGGLLWQHVEPVEHGTWVTARAGQQVIHLSDGSTATLGGASELRASFSRHQRSLDLVRGEALFDVAHDPARPFIVTADGYRVVAIGTRFDVLDDADALRVVVTRGKVRLQPGADPALASALLPAGSVATVEHGNVLVRHVPLDAARDYTGWRDGLAVFHATPLAQAVAEFNRYNAQPIDIADPSLDGLRIGGQFRLDNSAAFVRVLGAAFPIRATQHDGSIELSRRGEGVANG